MTFICMFKIFLSPAAESSRPPLLHLLPVGAGCFFFLPTWDGTWIRVGGHPRWVGCTFPNRIFKKKTACRELLGHPILLLMFVSQFVRHRGPGVPFRHDGDGGQTLFATGWVLDHLSSCASEEIIYRCLASGMF